MAFYCLGANAKYLLKSCLHLNMYSQNKDVDWSEDTDSPQLPE